MERWKTSLSNKPSLLKEIKMVYEGLTRFDFALIIAVIIMIGLLGYVLFRYNKLEKELKSKEENQQNDDKEQ